MSKKFQFINNCRWFAQKANFTMLNLDSGRLRFVLQFNINVCSETTVRLDMGDKKFEGNKYHRQGII